MVSLVCKISWYLFISLCSYNNLHSSSLCFLHYSSSLLNNSLSSCITLHAIYELSTVELKQRLTCDEERAIKVVDHAPFRNPRNYRLGYNMQATQCQVQNALLRTKAIWDVPCKITPKYVTVTNMCHKLQNGH